MKTIYFSMTTHPNMNYDRSLRSVIWEQFPKLYRLYLDYMQEHPGLKSHMQLPPQTLLSLKQCAPDVIEQAQRLRAAGRLKFMGTFFSESIAQCQDGMSVLDAAELGCGIASAELGAELEGFFLQEVAYTPQLPYVINKLGVQWTIIRDWEDSLRPFWAEGLDGTRCVAVPLIEGAQRTAIRSHPDLLPDKALLITHCDMEIPVAIRVMHELQEFLEGTGRFETRWCFVSEYLAEVGVETVKRPTPCTNKPQDRTESPSLTRWCGDHLSMQLHRATLEAMEARRCACLAGFGTLLPRSAVPDLPAARPCTTWEVESPWLYPELVRDFAAGAGRPVSPYRQLAMLIAWGSNSDGRGWYPMLERRFERTDSFAEAELLADHLSRAACGGDGQRGNGLLVVHPHGVREPAWTSIRTAEPLAFVDATGADAVQMVRRDGNRWEHLLRVDVEPYAAIGLTRERRPRRAAREEAGHEVSNGAFSAAFAEGVLRLASPGRREMTLGLDRFRLCLKSIDRELRDPQPEGDWRVTVIPGLFPRLIACRQIDYHVHFRAEYALDGDRLFADWRFHFTYPALIDSLDDFDAGGPKADFEPGGLCALLGTGTAGEVWYDVPFGVVRHPNPEVSFVPPLTHAFLAQPGGGVALVSQDGSQSFRVDASGGRLGLCMGRSITSGGRRKLQHWAGTAIDDYGCDTDWYKEFFHGELRHRFVVRLFGGDWREEALPNRCRALAHGPRWLESVALPDADRRLAELTPAQVRLAGLEPDTGRVVLCEMCGRETDYRLRLGDVERSGHLQPFGIAECTLAG
ncbi:MAG: hypothetical protein JXR77_01665 [Lentisphaeria bacterium]|nr:hypothetical protein [Lentisphaeria bacterium]